jgi:hypothetical protein
VLYDALLFECQNLLSEITRAIWVFPSRLLLSVLVAFNHEVINQSRKKPRIVAAFDLTVPLKTLKINEFCRVYLSSFLQSPSHLLTEGSVAMIEQFEDVAHPRRWKAGVKNLCHFK